MTLLTILFTLTTATLQADPLPLGDYFGFSSLDSIKIGDHAGPMYQGDLNGDGLIDLLIINNHKSRIDLLLQKRNASPDDDVEVTRANEIPDHWRFEKEHVMVSHKVSAITLHDFNEDGLTDIIYASNPSNIVFLAQKPDGTFEKERQHRLRKLHANRSGFIVTDIVGDDAPELVTLVDGNIQVLPLEGDALGKPITFTTEDKIGWFILADYDGNGLRDIAGIARDSSEPLRLWLARQDGTDVRMGPQLRFEMPTMRDFAAIELPNRDDAMMAVIERSSKRIVLYELAIETIESSGDREASIEVFPFQGKEKRNQTIADVNGDDLFDVIATNTDDNTIVIYPQSASEGLSSGVPSPTLSGVEGIAVFLYLARTKALLGARPFPCVTFHSQNQCQLQLGIHLFPLMLSNLVTHGKLLSFLSRNGTTRLILLTRMEISRQLILEHFPVVQMRLLHLMLTKTVTLTCSFSQEISQ